MASKRVRDRLPEPVKGALARVVVRDKPDVTENVDYNRDLWDWYARTWESDPDFRRDQAEVPDPGLSDADRFRVLGNEWGTSADVDRVLGDFLYPFVSEESVAAELGVGGGRIAARVAPRVKHLHALDISAGMIEHARQHLASQRNVSFAVLDGARLPAELAGQLDFLYSFDVMVHLDLHTIWKYVKETSTALRPGGRAFLHTTNLTAPIGWESFASQDAYRPEKHYFVSPEIVRTLVSHTDLELIKESEVDLENFYLGRDFLFVLEKPGGA